MVGRREESKPLVFLIKLIEDDNYYYLTNILHIRKFQRFYCLVMTPCQHQKSLHIHKINTKGNVIMIVQ